MKVVALIYGHEGRWDAFSEEEQKAVYDLYRAFGEAAGSKVVDGAELASTRSATTVRVRDGETIVTDGPFAEAKEQVGGYYVIDVPSIEEAVGWAKKIPLLPGDKLEVRKGK
jgi:hypothetical protein